MRFITHIIAADAEDLAAIAVAPDPLGNWSGVEAPGFDTVKFALLHSLLTGDPLHTALERYQPICTVADETIILHLSDLVVEKLASFDEDALQELAGELAATQAARSGVSASRVTRWAVNVVCRIHKRITSMAAANPAMPR